MEQASRWILFVAHWVAGLDGAVTPIPAPGPWVVPLFTLGALWAILWRGWGRAAGAGPVVAALVLWMMADRPALLISNDGRLAGLWGAEGRALSTPKGAGFAADSWLQNDGDLAGQQTAAARPGFSGPKDARRFTLGGRRGVVLTGSKAAGRAAQACRDVEIVIVADRVDPAPAGPCLLIDRAFLRKSGALALTIDGETLRLVPSRQAERLWAGEAPALPDIRLPPPQPVLAVAAQ